MSKKPSQGQKISFYPAFVSVVTATGYPMYKKSFEISDAVPLEKAQEILKNDGDAVIISPYVGLNAALNLQSQKNIKSQRLVRLAKGDTPDVLLAYGGIYVGETHAAVERFDGYGMQNIPATIKLPISNTQTLELSYSKVEFSCVVGKKVVKSDHVLYTNGMLHFDSNKESHALLKEVDAFNQTQRAVIVRKIPISHNRFIWGDDFPTDRSETIFTLALTDQPTLLLPPSPEGAERIGAYLRSSDVMSR